MEKIKTMKIVHVCLTAPYTDGWSYQENLLVKYHKLLGNNVTVITNTWKYDSNGKICIDDRSGYYDQNEAKIIRLKEKNNKNVRAKFRKYPELYISLVQESPDILFVHDVAFLDTKVINRFLNENQNVRCYADNHADYSNSATNWISKNILYKIIWRHYASYLISVVQKFYGVLPARVRFMTDLLKIPKEKSELLVMGADDELVQKSMDSNRIKRVRRALEVEEEDFLIVTGGKFDRFKTQTLLLMDAVNRLKGCKVKLVVFGAIDDELKENFLSKCSDNVKYIGWINAEQSYEIFAAAQLICFPGRHSVFWEQAVGQGIPLLVKYWEGTTHVDVGGNVEYIYNDSSDEIYKKIIDIMNNKYEKMKRVAENEGKKVFSYKLIAKRSIE